MTAKSDSAGRASLVTAYRTCWRYCDYASRCAAEPMSCCYYRHLICRPVYRRRGPLERLLQHLAAWWRRDAGAVVSYCVVMAALAYFTWHVMAALVEGRLALPLLR